jgi:Protein of unknown function (DUF429)
MVLVGLDPGGAGAFGWCVVDDGRDLPLRVRAAGVADDAATALGALDRARAGDPIVAAGIDAPMFWSGSGDRLVDQHVRRTICKLGAPGGTVGHVSSLRGACLVQGMVAAMMLRRQNPKMHVTEAHPKAALWILREATKERKVASISPSALTRYLDAGPQAMATDHERDSAIAALSAWAMVHAALGWEDIRGFDPDAVSPLAAPLGYWMPRAHSMGPEVEPGARSRRR